MDILVVRQPAHPPDNVNRDLALHSPQTHQAPATMGRAFPLGERATHRRCTPRELYFPLEAGFLVILLLCSPLLDPSPSMPKDVVVLALVETPYFRQRVTASLHFSSQLLSPAIQSLLQLPSAPLPPSFQNRATGPGDRTPGLQD